MADITNAEIVTSARAQIKAIIDFGIDNYSIDQQNVARQKIKDLTEVIKTFEGMSNSNSNPRVATANLSGNDQ